MSIAKSITFKELTYGHSQPLKLTETTFNTKDLHPDQILVETAAAAINPIDLLLLENHKYMFLSRSQKHFGRDFSGVVVSTGSNVTNYKKGDKISGILDQEGYQSLAGSFAEYITLDVTKNANIGKIPETLTLNEAASFNLVLGTAWTLFTHEHKPTKDSRVLIIGGGTSVGNYAIQLLRHHFNVESIISINSGKSTQSVTLAGANHIIDYKVTPNTAEEVIKLIKDEFQGEKLDLICDCVGNQEFFPVMDKVLKQKNEGSGYVTIVGDQVLDYTQALNPFKLAYKAASKSLIPRSYNYKFSSIQHGGWYEKVKELIEDGTIRVHVNKVVKGLENWKEVVDEVKDHQAQGKVVLEIKSGLD